MGEEKAQTAGPDDVVYDPALIYNEEGVDLTVVRAALAKTPAERLRDAQNFVNDVLRIRALNGRV